MIFVVKTLYRNVQKMYNQDMLLTKINHRYTAGFIY